ncbi:MAG: hypothetical protein COA62_15835 [Rhodobiaceae bacterium]|nr:MAG: hypothetical protein COA62_15835 [Rhodobiaceae bacterium]
MQTLLTHGQYATTVAALLGARAIGFKVDKLPQSLKYRLSYSASHLIYVDGDGRRKVKKIVPTHNGMNRVAKIAGRRLVRERGEEMRVLGDQRPAKYLHAHARRARFESDGLNDGQRAQIVADHRKSVESAA